MKKMLIFSLIILIFLGTISIIKKQNDKIDLDTILSNEHADLAINKIDEQLNKISNYCKKIEKLNKSQRILIIIENLEREINNGGFNQFYFNSSGNYANETVEYLKKIGANKTTAIVIKANNEWKNGIVPIDRAESKNILEKIEKKANFVWGNVMRSFMNIKMISQAY